MCAGARDLRGGPNQSYPARSGHPEGDLRLLQRQWPVLLGKLLKKSAYPLDRAAQVLPQHRQRHVAHPNLGLAPAEHFPIVPPSLSVSSSPPGRDGFDPRPAGRGKPHCQLERDEPHRRLAGRGGSLRCPEPDVEAPRGSRRGWLHAFAGRGGAADVAAGGSARTGLKADVAVPVLLGFQRLIRLPLRRPPTPGGNGCCHAGSVGRPVTTARLRGRSSIYRSRRGSGASDMSSPAGVGALGVWVGIALSGLVAPWSAQDPGMARTNAVGGTVKPLVTASGPGRTLIGALSAVTSQ